MPFVKLDCGILNSTLWFDRQARDVFITALLMAEPYELLEPIQQIHVDSLEYTGWLVPAGWYGFVPAAGVGITHRAGIEESEGREALRVLGSPENSSRTPDYEGRRLVRINGGYLVLNFIKYREKDASAADRQRRWRERQKAKAKGKPSRVTESPLRVISNQAEAEAEAEVQQLAPLAVTPPAKTTAKPLAYRPRIDVAWPGRPNVPGSLHAEFRTKLGGDPETADARLHAWYPIAAAPFEDQPIGDDDFRFWRSRFREWLGTTEKPARATKSAAPTPVYNDEDWCHHDPPCGSRDWHAMKVQAEHA